MEERMTHAELVERAGKWLRNTRKCGVVLLERVSGAAHEIPDAIGWHKTFFSILVECKATRGDFLKDKTKFVRRHEGMGMGQERIYLTNLGVVKGVEEIPPGWGWAVVDGKIVRVMVPAPRRDFDYEACRRELGMLYGFARRAQLGCEPTVGILAPAILAPALDRAAELPPRPSFT
jgi:hypothetical protein